MEGESRRRDRDFRGRPRAATGETVTEQAGLAEPVGLDEVQRVPALFLAIKAAVDRDRRPGRFLLTGSVDVLLLPQAADALVGRMALHTLWPFSQGEVADRSEGSRYRAGGPWRASR